MQKKKAPIASSDIAEATGHDWDSANSYNFLKIDIGIAFCCFTPGSRFVYPLYNWFSMKQVVPSLSSVGFGLLRDRKACATYPMVSLIVPAAISLVLPFVTKEHSLMAWAKAVHMICRFHGVNDSRRSSPLMPMVGRKSCQSRQDRTRLVNVVSAAAAELATEAEWRRAIVRLLWELEICESEGAAE